jgi:hypothetical protein
LVLVWITQEAEPLFSVGMGVLVQWSVVDARRGTGDLTVVGWRVEVYNMESVFEKVDTRDKGISLDAILVEVIWVTVGGCD